MNKYMSIAASVFQMLRNKIVAIVVLVILAVVYLGLPSDKPVPFAELLYAAVLIGSVLVLGPLVRLLVFNEAARYAESGQLDEDLARRQAVPPLAYLHYRFATIVSYAIALLCVSSLLR